MIENPTSHLDELMRRCREDNHALTYKDLAALRAAIEADRVSWDVTAPLKWPIMPKSRGQSSVLFDDGYEEGWSRCLEECRQMIDAAAPKPVQLTEDQIRSAVRDAGMMFTHPDLKVARAIEAAHGIGTPASAHRPRPRQEPDMPTDAQRRNLASAHRAEVQGLKEKITELEAKLAQSVEQQNLLRRALLDTEAFKSTEITACKTKKATDQ